MNAKCNASSERKLHDFRDDFIKQDYVANTDFDLCTYVIFTGLT